MNEAPANANEGCVGPSSESAGRADACAGCPNQKTCASGEAARAAQETQVQRSAVSEVMKNIGRTLLVLSGKGGVGKSTVASQLAFALARSGRRVGLLDLDICGPSIPLMLGLSGREVHQSASGWSPVFVDVEPNEGVEDADCELGVMSIGFLMPDQDSAVIWRGPRKNGLIQQFFTSVDWGELDYLVIDTPPGTSDEHISIVQLLKDSLKQNDGAIVVSTPQEVAMMDVRKELNFCKQTDIQVLGVIENMAAMNLDLELVRFSSKGDGSDTTEKTLESIKEKCPELLDQFVQVAVFPASAGGPATMASKFGVPFLGRIPLDPMLQTAGERGHALDSGNALFPLKHIIEQITASEKTKVTNMTNHNGVDEGVVNM